MTVTVASFREIFPEFSDTTKYPDATVTFWLTQAGVTLPSAIPAEQIDLATMLYIAHNLVLARLSAAGGGSGVALAPQTSASVGGVSKTVDVSLVANAKAGVLNATTYGQRLAAFLRGITAGPFYRPSARAVAYQRARAFPYRW